MMARARTLVIAAVGMLLVPLGSWADDAQMSRMLELVSEDFQRTAAFTGIASMSPPVYQALEAVPRQHYVRPSDQRFAYVNRPLSIGHGQTISQPFIVALMTELANLSGGERVLEIGTGSGYQAAVLAEIATEVYTVELIPELSRHAAEVIAEQDITNIRFRVGDGNQGWSEFAPFDVIVVTAGGSLPPALVAQLAPGGRMIIPLDQEDGGQMLTVVTRDSAGDVVLKDVLPVRFVPLVKPVE